MKIYFAPMEGITGLVCRNAYEACFSGTIEKYYAPFITATTQKSISEKELKDILPERNRVPYLVPQILANRGDAFVKTAEAMVALGYKEINLNLGCPSRTVVTKKKGAGYLEFPNQVDVLLQEICAWAEKENVRISVKTRLGISDEDEFWSLLDVYNKHSFHELIVHLRLLDDYYAKPVRTHLFADIQSKSKHVLCYNGDIWDEAKLREFAEAYPQEDRVMLGRGLLMHPGILADAKVERSRQDVLADLWRFHDMVYEGYREYIRGEKNVLFKMKELWAYLGVNFEPEEKTVKKNLKMIRKSQSCADYESAVRQMKSVR